MFWISLAIFVFFIICFYTGLAHVAFRLQLNREKDGQHLTDSTNGLEGFALKVEKTENAGVHKRVFGKFKGALPRVGDVLLLDNQRATMPVRVLKVKKGTYDYDSNTFEASIVLFGAKESFLASGCKLTNIRKKETVVQTKQVKRKKSVDVHYPIVIKSTAREYISAVFVILLGAFESFVIIASIVNGLKIDFGTVIVGIMGIAFVVIGIYLLVSAFLFLIKLDEDGTLTLAKQLKVKLYQPHEYNYKAMVLRSNNRESYVIYITDPSKQQTYCTIADTNKEFNDIYNALKDIKG